MDALCLTCEAPVSGEYDLVDERVVLVRLCPEHGLSRSEVSRDQAYFTSAVDQAALITDRRPRGLIVEVIDGCNMRCPTCIASTEMADANPREIGPLIERLNRFTDLPAILLSGGEPTIHPQFFDLVRAVATLNVPKKVLITNGVLLAREDGFAAKLATAVDDSWEVFLQFDTLDNLALIDLRGEPLADVRRGALTALDAVGIATTLVSVAKRGVSLHTLSHVLDTAAEHACVTGVQIQPIRNAGRVENYAAELNSCTTSDVINVIEAGGTSFRPHPDAPLAIALANFNREARLFKTAPAMTAGKHYLDPSLQDANEIRVSIAEYSDCSNWTSLKSSSTSLEMLQADGSRVSVDDHFVGVGAAVA